MTLQDILSAKGDTVLTIPPEATVKEVGRNGAPSPWLVTSFPQVGRVVHA